MNRLLTAALFSIIIAGCGGESEPPTPTPTKTPMPVTGALTTETPIPAEPLVREVVAPTAAPPPTAAIVAKTATETPWDKIVMAYVSPDGNPDDLALAHSFTDIMALANDVVMDTSTYNADEAARAQAIFDAAADAHDALMAGDSEMLALRWKSLDTFVALLKNQ